MIVVIAITQAWWCRCGWYALSKVGGAQRVREHMQECSAANRFGDDVQTRWSASERVHLSSLNEMPTYVWTDSG